MTLENLNHHSIYIQNATSDELTKILEMEAQESPIRKIDMSLIKAVSHELGRRLALRDFKNELLKLSAEIKHMSSRLGGIIGEP